MEGKYQCMCCGGKFYRDPNRQDVFGMVATIHPSGDKVEIKLDICHECGDMMTVVLKELKKEFRPNENSRHLRELE